MSHARIEICPECGKHGRIVLADGFIGLEFCFQRHAHELVRSGVEEFENISAEDAEQLLRAITESTLPFNWDRIDLLYHWKIEQWNQFRMRNGKFHPAGPHRFLESVFPYVTYPSDFRSVLEQAFPL